MQLYQARACRRRHHAIVADRLAWPLAVKAARSARDEATGSVDVIRIGIAVVDPWMSSRCHGPKSEPLCRETAIFATAYSGEVGH